jgi:hypothetical protein
MRNKNVHMYIWYPDETQRHTDTQTRKHADTRRYTDTRIHGYKDTRLVYVGVC